MPVKNGVDFHILLTKVCGVLYVMESVSKQRSCDGSEVFWTK